jgi:hypothetical protein
MPAQMLRGFGKRARILDGGVAGVRVSERQCVFGVAVVAMLLFSTESAVPALSQQPMLSVGRASGSEDARAVVFAVRLSRASTSTVKVRYATAEGSASSGKDYVTAKGTVLFRRGERLKRVRVALVDDSAAEPEETLFLVLSRARGARIAVRRTIGLVAASDLPAPFRSRATMDGAKEASQGDPTARATALLTFNAAEERMSYTLTIENAARAFTVAHIHPGRADSLAAPVVRFEELPPMNGTISGSKRVELNAILQIHTDPGAFWFQYTIAEGSTVGTIGGPLSADT